MKPIAQTLSSVQWWKKMALRYFSVDIRALAIMRISIALIVIIDLITRSLSLIDLHGSQSIFPLSGVLPGSYWSWSLHALGGGSSTVIIGLFIVHGVAALCLLVGYHTRLASIVTWALLISLHHANTYLLYGGDFLLRSLLLIGIFLPWGDILSLDQKIKHTEVKSTQIFSSWTVALLLQLAIVYLFAALYKHVPSWENGLQVYYALSNYAYKTEAGALLLAQTSLLPILTMSIFYFQQFLPLLLFFPIYTKMVRGIALVGIFIMHISLTIFLNIQLFSWIILTGALGFFPSEFWNKAYTLRTKVSSTQTTGDNSKTYGYIFIFYYLGFIYIAAIALINIYQYPPLQTIVKIPTSFFQTMGTFGMDQGWKIFTPPTNNLNGWYVIPGTLKNGNKVDLFRDGSPVSFEQRDRLLSPSFNWRWQKVLESMTNETLRATPGVRANFAKILCRKWNAKHSGGETLENLEIIFMVQKFIPPGTVTKPAVPQSFLAWKCE